MGSVFRIFRGAVAFLFVSLILIIGGAYFARALLAERVINNALEQRGFQEVDVTVIDVHLHGIVIEKVTAHEGLEVNNLEAAWTLNSLRQGYVEALTVQAVRLPVTGSFDQPVIAGVALDRLMSGGKASGNGSYLAENLSLKSVILEVDLTSGPMKTTAIIDAAGECDFEKGGQFKAVLTSDVISVETTELTDVSASFDMSLDQSGKGAGRFSQTARIKAEGLEYGDVKLAGSLKSEDWQAALKDIATMKLSGSLAGEVTALPLVSLGSLGKLLPVIADQPVHTLGISFQSEYELDNQVITIRSDQEDVVSITTDTEMTAQLQSDGDVPLVRMRTPLKVDAAISSIMTSQGQLVVGGSAVAPATVKYTATRQEKSLQLAVQANVDAFEYSDIHIAPSEFTFSGEVDAAYISGDLKVSGGAADLKTHNARLQNLIGKGDFEVSINRGAQQMSLALDDNCLNFATPIATLKTSTFRLRKAKICKQHDEPHFVILNYADPDHITATSSIVFSADGFAAEYGETRLSGRPPNANIDIQVNGHRLDSQARFSNGTVNIDEQLEVSSIQAKSEIGYQDGVLSVRADLQNAQLHDLTKPTKLAPMMFNGAVSVLSDQATFKGGLYTNFDTKLAQAEGQYHLGKAEGIAEIDFGTLTFLPNGLQPDSISPALKGFMENADGQLSGKVHLKFLDKKIQTVADFEVAALTFNGPTLAVTQTKGLNGKVRFASLIPVRTDGLQQATIELVDMDALRLENGIIQYQAVGDETVQVEKAEWDWFEGKVGIYNEVIPLKDVETSSLTLTVRDIDLGKLLADFDVQGLSGEGKITGTLPIIFEDGEARFENGELRTVGTGVVRFESAVTDGAARNTGEAGKIAFEALKEFRFEQLTTTINGPLSGDVDVQISMEGSNKNVVSGAGIKYNVNITAPLSGLVDQARASEKAKSDILRQFEEKYGIEVLEKKTTIKPQ